MALARLAATAPLLLALGSMALGVCVADALSLSPYVVAIFLGATLPIVVTTVRRRRGEFAAACLVFFLTGALATTSETRPPALSASCNDSSDLWRARVVRVLGRVHRTGKPELQRRVHLDLLAERCGDVWQPRRGRVFVRLEDHGVLASDDVLELRLRVEPLSPARNPTDPNPLLLARRDGISGQATALSPYAFVRHATTVSAWIDRARDAAGSRFEDRFGVNYAAIAKALSSGDQSEVSDDMRERWSVAGTTHLLSVSGLHVTLVATVVFWLVAHLLALLPGFAERYSARRLAAGLAIPPLILFCVWAGAPAPAVRATVMGVALLVGLAIARPHAVLNAAGLAGILIVAIAPASLYDPGFLLSFAAILLLLAVPSSPHKATVVARAWRALCSLTLASIVATLATAPITAYYFGRVSLAAPLTNLVAVPLGSAIATPLALTHTLVAGNSPRLGDLVAMPLALVLHALDAIASAATHIPLASVDVPAPTPLEATVYYVGLVGALAARHHRRLRRICLALVPAVALVITARIYYTRHTHELVLTHPYVGQGDATLVRFPSGEVMLVDAGGSNEPLGYDPGQRTLAPLLRRSGIHTLDIAVVSHPHPDHLNGFAYLAEHFGINELWWNGEGEELPTMHRLLTAVRQQGGTVHTSAALPERFSRGGVTLEVLHPRHDTAAGLDQVSADANDNSLVLRLAFGQHSFLLPGDLGVAAEATLLAKMRPVDLVKIAHHGSRTASSDLFLEAIRPRLAILSVGHHNVFRLPNDDVLERYRAHGATVLRTDEDGLIETHTDGKRLVIHTYRGRVMHL